MPRDSRPLIARLLLDLFLRGRGREFIRGDIEEEYEQRLHTTGESHARAWYWQQTLRSIAVAWSPRQRESHKPRTKLLAGTTGVHSFWQDVRYAARVMKSRPLLTATAVLTIALGIGPTTVIFSVSNWVLFRPIPGLSEPDQLVWGWVGRPSQRPGAITVSRVSYLNHADMMEQVTALDGFVGRQGSSVHVGAEGVTPVVRSAEFVMDRYFEVLGVQPFLGRDFTSQEMNSTDAHVTIISHNMWRTLLNQDPAVLGRTIAYNGRPFTIIGVTPKGFFGTDRMGRVDLWIPGGVQYFVRHMDFDLFGERDARGYYEFVGRLAPGHTMEQAQAQLDVAMANLAVAYPEVNEKFKEVRATLFPEIGLHPELQREITATVRLLFYVVALVLLIACANVANVLICRGVTRRAEGAVRKALGASSWRIIRQHLTESGIISLIGGTLGLAIAIGVTQFLEGMMINRLGSLEGISVDLRVLSFAFAVSVVAGILFGIAPAIFATRIDLATSLKDSARAETGKRPYVRRGLAALQLALSLTLVVGALLFIQTLQNYSRIDLGFDPENVTVFAVDTRDHGYTPDRSRQYYTELIRRIRSTPGIEHVSIAGGAPFNSGGSYTRIHAEGEDRDDARQEILTNSISPEYFAALHLPVRTGLTEFWRDEIVAAEGPELIVVLSESLARELFGGREAVGRYVGFNTMRGGNSLYRVVGTVADSRWNSLTEDQSLMVYEPFGQQDPYLSWATILVRSSLGDAAAVAAVREAAKAVDGTLPLSRVQSLTHGVGRELSQQRLFASLIGAFAVLALLLAAVGLYGLVAYGVAERTHEFGIRRAMGAQNQTILGLVLRQAVLIAAIGVVLGVAGAIGVESLIKSKLFGVAELNPLVYGTAAVVLVLAALLASIVPARAATKVDPLVALRYE
jgi:predicted permease